MKLLAHLGILLRQVLAGAFRVIDVEGAGAREHDLDIRIGDVQRHSRVGGLGADLDETGRSQGIEGDARIPELRQGPALRALHDGRQSAKPPHPVLEIEPVVLAVGVVDEVRHGRAGKGFDDRLGQNAALKDGELDRQRPPRREFLEERRWRSALQKDHGGRSVPRRLLRHEIGHGEEERQGQHARQDDPFLSPGEERERNLLHDSQYVHGGLLL